MFIVYSPEGQNKITSARQLPLQKISSVQRVNPVSESSLSSLNTEESSTNQANLHATAAYKENQKSQRQKVTKAAQLMSNPVIVVAANATLEYAWQLMQEESIKHLPVIDDGSVVGICTQDAILRRVYFDEDNKLRGDLYSFVSGVMQDTVVTTAADTDVRQVAQVLMSYEIDALLVMENEEVLGIITEKDLINRLAQQPPLELFI